MLYFSTNKEAPAVDFKAATIKGQAPDKGLYFPEIIPELPISFFDDLKRKSKEEIAFQVIRPYIGNTISEEDLFKIVSETVNFNFPLVKVSEGIYTLELFHGPTLAFKDVGARFMSRCLGHFSKDVKQKIVVLVATSGDTGGAVANGFYGVDGVEVVILYPSGKVSSVQEKQLTTLGKNIHALEVKGTFDDCQAMVKKAFADEQLSAELFLTSANSINVARWLPQQFYYFYAAQQWEGNEAPVISVPSGNFGNICAGALAYRSGLPVKHFVAACNANDMIPGYFAGGKLEPKAAIATISNAMDVGNPSNFIRILNIFENQFPELSRMMSSYSFSDQETRDELKKVKETENYLLDPHGAVGLLGLKKYLQENNIVEGYFLETAHPVKFYDVVEPITGEPVPVPDLIQAILPLQKKSTVIEGRYEELKGYLESIK
jgi:threonine synthase